ncbi:NAD(P)-dependent oxidoreductase [Pseudonocardia eucalypti]|uniref:NAD(P)-dependent oxidoreductase n=1 Tax=Pseudonocardia eucalypti TaxID=648755 RepID=A0ABP9QM80_9PSEU|nr:3-hydroxyisobutyrate dehydrogenase [Pseudonocardia eucalypti]
MADPLPPAVGFVGLGRMGDPMTRRIAAAGVEVRGFDVSPDAVRALDGVVTRVDSAADAARGTGVVILMLPDSDVVERVVDDELLDALVAPVSGDGRDSATRHSRPLLVDMSSSEPLRTRALAERVASRGATLVDAPVSGGVSGARAGTLTIMVGGPSQAAERLEPLLALMGRVRHVGEVGAGHALKALNNLLSASHLLASSEAILAGRRFGLDPAVMLDAINGSSGRSGSTQNKWPNHILPGSYDSGFTASLLVKDIKIALALAEATGAPHEHAEHTVRVWSRAVEKLGPAADHTEIARWLEEQ